MAREGLLAELRTAIHAARKKEGLVRRDGLRIKTNSHVINGSIEVIPFIGSGGERYFLVLFEQAEGKAEKPFRAARTTPNQTQEIDRLEREIDATRDYLQSIIEAPEAMNTVIRSGKEEIQS